MTQKAILFPITFHFESMGGRVKLDDCNGHPCFIFIDDDSIRDVVVDHNRTMHADFFYTGMPEDVVLIEWYDGNEIYCDRVKIDALFDTATMEETLLASYKEAKDYLTSVPESL